MTDPKVSDPGVWKRKAMAFVIRAHRHLWGKNNEDPLVFLYTLGLANEFSKSIYLGWNKFSQERPASGWGLSGGKKLLLPSGIVVPHIRDKELLSVFILSMDAPSRICIVPGSRSLPGSTLVLGNGRSKAMPVRDIIQGLCLLQDHGGETRVRIQLP